jgi:ferredoxin-fold anticodon binding domain-containing protein
VGKNTKPILSVLVEEDKKEKFAELARRYKYSMGWILNDCIDRMLAADSMDIYRGSASNEDINRQPTDNNVSIGLSAESIDEMVKASIEKQVSDVSVFLPIESIEQMAIGAMDKHLEELNINSIGKEKGSIEDAISPFSRLVEGLREELAEVSEFARNLQGEIVKVKKPLAIV